MKLARSCLLYVSAHPSVEAFVVRVSQIYVSNGRLLLQTSLPPLDDRTWHNITESCPQ